MPSQVPKNLLDMRDDVLNVRLSAANTSLWSIAATVTERVDRAINDALDAYPFMIRATAYSIRYMPQQMPIILPGQAERILEVYAYHVSDMTTRVQVNQYRHVPTLWTNMLDVEIPEYARNTSIGKASAQFWVGVEYEYRQREMPKPVSLEYNIRAQDTSIPVNNLGNLVHFWAEDGFAALTSATPATLANKYEIFWYGGRYMHANRPSGWHPNYIGPPVPVKEVAIGPVETTTAGHGGFKAIERAQLGTFAHTFMTTDSVWISPVVVLPPEAYAVIILEAQANMYQYWVAHRAAYDQWAASSQMQQLDSVDILTLVQTLRKQAQEKYIQLNRPLKKAVAGPTYMTLDRRGDIDV
jgi:hypothetical protein